MRAYDGVCVGRSKCQYEQSMANLDLREETAVVLTQPQTSFGASMHEACIKRV